MDIPQVALSYGSVHSTFQHTFARCLTSEQHRSNGHLHCQAARECSSLGVDMDCLGYC